MGRHLHAPTCPEALSCKVWVSPRVTPPQSRIWAGQVLSWSESRDPSNRLWSPVAIKPFVFFLQKFRLCFNLTLNTAGKNQYVTLPATDWCPTEQFARAEAFGYVKHSHSKVLILGRGALHCNIFYWLATKVKNGKLSLTPMPFTLLLQAAGHASLWIPPPPVESSGCMTKEWNHRGGRGEGKVCNAMMWKEFSLPGHQFSSSKYQAPLSRCYRSDSDPLLITS